MAINVELMHSTGTVREAGRSAQALVMPLLQVNRLAAAGDIALHTAGEVFVLTNKGDPVWFRVCKIVDNGSSAAGNNSASVLLQTGDELSFGLDPNVDAALYNVRVAAVA